MFYETDTCRTGGKFFYISDIEHGVGAQKPQAIRSFMFGNDHNYMRRPSFIYSKCIDNTEKMITIKEGNTTETNERERL
ncbi:hypothetical protein P3T76_003027 [Phytophthora citrophthora]|uniref:Uncharacterized protein n=1 Tax=Phytophthora citrophthora TaxID=4793 RepID=A0AAD9GWP4_9STRA|nr:hypothetical protein P3T76_003027 [Phytophthora citrophthora]